jgi:hypothetical protein
MKGDAGQATLENILGVTAKLAFIQRLALPCAATDRMRA